MILIAYLRKYTAYLGCWSLVLQDKCNIEIFLSPVLEIEFLEHLLYVELD